MHASIAAAAAQAMDRTLAEMPGPGPVHSYDADQELLELMNNERKRHGLVLLKKHPALLKSASWQAQDQAARNQCDHYGSDGSNWAERCAREGYPGAALDTIGENVAAGQTSPGQAFSDWMGSSGHRAAILNPEARHCGSASAIGSKGWTYWCTDFGWGAPDPEPTPDELDYLLIG